MKFNESNTVEAHLRDLLAGAAATRPAQLAPGPAHVGGRIAGLCSDYVAPGERDFFGSRLRSAVGGGRQLQ